MRDYSLETLLHLRLLQGKKNINKFKCKCMRITLKTIYVN